MRFLAWAMASSQPAAEIFRSSFAAIRPALELFLTVLLAIPALPPRRLISPRSGGANGQQRNHEEFRSRRPPLLILLGQRIGAAADVLQD